VALAPVDVAVSVEMVLLQVDLELKTHIADVAVVQS